MNLFIQGMRRSGTTILYDALGEDPELRRFYEPFREEAETVGGGSGARAEDLFAETRTLRRAFQRSERPEVPLELFNHGGPRAPALELHPRLPDWGAEFLAHLLDQAPQALVKEVRLYRKIADLHRVDPEAALVHIVRDPRAVSGSMLMGRGRRHGDLYPDADAFFGAWSERKLWSSRDLSEALVESGAYPGLEGGMPDFMKPLAVWKAAWEGVREDGQRHFGERYVTVRLEDLRSDPAPELGRIYAALGRETPVAVVEWAAQNVRPGDEVGFGHDPRWAEAVRLLDMEEVVADAGYEEMLRPARGGGPRVRLEPPDASSSTRLGAAAGKARRGIDRATGRDRR